MKLNFDKVNYYNKLGSVAIKKILSEKKIKKQINFVNPHSYVISKSDFNFFNTLKNSEFNFIDGVGLSFLLKILFKKKIYRNTGYNIFVKFLRRLKGNTKILFIGSTTKELKKIKINCKKYYKLNNICSYSPPFKKDFDKKDLDNILEIVNNSKPDHIFLGISAPKQEKLANFIKKKSSHNFNSIFCIGAAFDYFTGNLPRPNKRISKYGLEWIYRFYKQPRVVWKRILITGPLYFIIFIKKLLLKDYSDHKQFFIKEKKITNKNSTSIELTIATIVKNSFSNIDVTINQVLDNINDKIQYIIIDGSSSDGTLEKIKNILYNHRNGNKVDLFIVKDTNVYQSINYINDKAKGKYITFLHAGDFYYKKDSIKKISQSISSNCDIYFSNAVYYLQDKVTRVWKPKIINKKLDYFQIPHTTLIMKKDLINYVSGYNDNFKISSDVEFLNRLSRINISFQYIKTISLAMMDRGLSTDARFLYRKFYEDLTIMYNIYKFSFLKYMLKKTFIKVPGFFYRNKNLFFKKIQSSLKKDNFNDPEFYMSDFNNIYYYNYKPQIKMIRSVEKIPFDKNFILSGLNLAFLGSFGLNRVPLSKLFYHWPDGIFHYRLFKNKSKKIPGREIVDTIEIPKFIKKIRVIGNLSPTAKKKMEFKFSRFQFIHTQIGYGNLNDELKKIKSIESDEIIFLTLPSPKQEILALKLEKKFRSVKIICIGGAINIFSGEEKAVPEILDKMGLEFLWRLRTDTKRRFARLLITFLGYIAFENSKISKKIKLILI